MSLNILRVYVENSVIGGCFDEEFQEPTRKLFELFRSVVYKPVISSHVHEELDDGAPNHVKDVLNSIIYEKINLSEEMILLAEKYLQQKIVTQKYRGDALHIAIATISQVDILVSWNCRHIVNLNKIRLFNAVNLMEGYKLLEIRTPKEIINYE